MGERAPEITQDCAFYCFDVLQAHLNDKPLPNAPLTIPNDDLCLFVTWKKNGRLAGCKGITGYPRPFRNLLQRFAIDSAENDSRFKPLKAKDIPNLDCSVSALHSFEPADHPLDWVVGVHGIRIDFKVDGHHYAATYLPHVASEQGWTTNETLHSLVLKSGYKGRVDKALKDKMETERYQATVVHCTYDEWKKSKK